MKNDESKDVFIGREASIIVENLRAEKRRLCGELDEIMVQLKSKDITIDEYHQLEAMISGKITEIIIELGGLYRKQNEGT